MARQGGPPGGGAGPSTARGRGAASSSGAGPSSSGARKPEPHDPNAGRSDATPKQKELVARITRTKDYYELFGVGKSASEDEIKRAYRKLALQLHPDKNTAPGAEEAFKKVNKAWDVLSDKNKRATYDTFGAEAAEGRPGAGGNPFGGFGGGGFPGGGFPGGAAGGFHGVPLEEILRQFQRQGGMGGMGGGGFPGGGFGFGNPGAGGNGGGMPNVDFRSILSNLSPQAVIYAIPLILMVFQALSSLLSVLINYWYVLLVLPLVPAQHRKQAVMMMIMYSMFGGFLL